VNINNQDWITLDECFKQRLEAIDLFLDDIYTSQNIINDGIIPRELIGSSDGWRAQMLGFKPPLNKWCQISGGRTFYLVNFA